MMSNVCILLADTGSQPDNLDLYYLLLIGGILNEAQIENACEIMYNLFGNVWC